VLRQPLEERHVTIGRARATYRFPSYFILAAAMNPCPCGYFGAETTTHSCTCSPQKIENYRSKISGPLLDRIDLQIEVPRIEYGQLMEGLPQLSSKSMKAQVDFRVNY
jgi:magnesium chelatase family protein